MARGETKEGKCFFTSSKAFFIISVKELRGFMEGEERGKAIEWERKPLRRAGCCSYTYEKRRNAEGVHTAVEEVSCKVLPSRLIQRGKD